MNKKNILICDDELGVREALNLILEDKHNLTFAENGNDAIQEVKNTKFDVILLDIKMPTKDGLETLEEIRQIDPNVKVIIVTGYQSVETAAKAVKLGATDYITKPFESAEVLEKIERI